MADCDVCDGTGMEERERVVYGHDANGPYQSIWPYVRTCETCGGSGEADEDE